MNSSVITKLIKKDFDLSFWPMLGCLALVLAGAAVIYIGTTRLTFAFGTMMMVMGPTLAGALIANTSMVSERRDQTLAFIMSLPVTIMDYTWSKLFYALTIYLFIWMLSLGLMETLIINSPARPGIIAAFAVIYGALLCVSVLTMTVALVTGSRRWTSTVTGASGALIGLSAVAIGRVTGVGDEFRSQTLHWTPAILGTFAGEALLVVLMLGTAVLLQARKKDFV